MSLTIHIILNILKMTQVKSIGQKNKLLIYNIIITLLKIQSFRLSIRNLIT
jgi:hypothetical protein